MPPAKTPTQARADEAVAEVADLVDQVRKGSIPLWLVAVLIFAPGGVSGLVSGVGAKLAIGDAASTVGADVTRAVHDAVEPTNSKVAVLAHELSESQASFAAFVAKCRAERVELNSMVIDTNKALGDIQKQVRDLNGTVREHMDQTGPKQKEDGADASEAKQDRRNA